MKISVMDFELRLVPFLKRIADTMPTSLHKWLGGAMVAANAKKIEGLLQQHADAEGLVDTDELKSVVDGGFASCGGEVSVPFGNDGLSAFGVRPVTVKLTKADTDAFFASLG